MRQRGRQDEGISGCESCKVAPSSFTSRFDEDKRLGHTFKFQVVLRVEARNFNVTLTINL